MAQSLVPVRAKVDLFPSALCVRLTWIGLWCRGQVGTELLGSQRGIKDKPPRLPERCSRFILATICIHTIKFFTLPEIKTSYNDVYFINTKKRVKNHLSGSKADVFKLFVLCSHQSLMSHLLSHKAKRSNELYIQKDRNSTTQSLKIDTIDELSKSLVIN